MKTLKRHMMRQVKYYALKNVLTDELVDAFDRWSKETRLSRPYDYLSVDPFTGKVEIVMDNELPTAQIAPALLKETVYDEAGQPLPTGRNTSLNQRVTEWNNESQIQLWLDEYIGKYIIVDKVQSDGPNENMIIGRWRDKGDLIAPQDTPQSNYRSYHLNRKTRKKIELMAKSIIARKLSKG